MITKHGKVAASQGIKHLQLIKHSAEIIVDVAEIFLKEQEGASDPKRILPKKKALQIMIAKAEWILEQCKKESLIPSIEEFEEREQERRCRPNDEATPQ
jgi:hypothetical protein